MPSGKRSDRIVWITHLRRNVRSMCRLKRALRRVFTGSSRTQSNPAERMALANPWNRSSFTVSSQNGAQTKVLRFLSSKCSAPRRPMASLSSMTHGIPRSFLPTKSRPPGCELRPRSSPILPNVRQRRGFHRLSIRPVSLRHKSCQQQRASRVRRHTSLRHDRIRGGLKLMPAGWSASGVSRGFCNKSGVD